MKEIIQIVEAYHKIDFSNNQLAMATVVRVEGSSYRRTGARMLVMESGEWLGGISGGCLEGDALKKARLVIAQNKAKLVTYDTTNDDPYQIGISLGCNGIIDVLISPLNPENPNNALLLLENCINKREPNVIITITGLNKNQKNIELGQVFRFDNEAYFSSKFPLNEILSDVIFEIKSALEKVKSVSKEYVLNDGNMINLFFEVIPPAIQLYVYGSNYDVYPIVRVAKELGWRVVCICNPLKMHSTLFELADEVVSNDYEPKIDAFSAAISMHHDYENDFQNLKKLLKTSIPYIGLLGPKKRTEKMYKQFIEEGISISESDEKRIFSPVGLDIGAASPEEIAMSVCAEIKGVFSGRNGGNLRLREKPIYEE